MKKFLFLTGMILAMGAFQSLKAQTFSRVVTVTKNLDQTECSQRRNQIDTLFVVPNGKILKVDLLQGSFQDAGRRTPVQIFVNNVLLTQYSSATGNYFYEFNGQNVSSISSTTGTSLWLKSGDLISFKLRAEYDCQVFLSGIEYDVP